MYRVTVLLSNGRTFEITSDSNEIEPCYMGKSGSLFFYYHFTDNKNGDQYIFPVYQVVSIDIKEISNEA